MYKDMDYLRNINLPEYYEKQPPVRKALSGIRHESDYQSIDDNDALYAKCKLIENMVYCVTPIVMPLHFRDTLALYNLTNSKSGLQMLNKNHHTHHIQH